MISDRREWHLEKNVSVGHIITTLTVVVAGVLYLAGVEKRVEMNSSELRHHTENIIRVEAAQKSQNAWISAKIDSMRKEQKSDTDRLEDKLDRLIERSPPSWPAWTPQIDMPRVDKQ